MYIEVIQLVFITETHEKQNVSSMCQVLLILFSKILYKKDDLKKEWLISDKKSNDQGRSKKLGACRVGKAIYLHKENDRRQYKTGLKT